MSLACRHAMSSGSGKTSCLESKLFSSLSIYARDSVVTYVPDLCINSNKLSIVVEFVLYSNYLYHCERDFFYLYRHLQVINRVLCVKLEIHH